MGRWLKVHLKTPNAPGQRVFSRGRSHRQFSDTPWESIEARNGIAERLCRFLLVLRVFSIARVKSNAPISYQKMREMSC